MIQKFSDYLICYQLEKVFKSVNKMCSHCPLGLYNLDIMIINQIECNKLLISYSIRSYSFNIKREFWVTVEFVKYDFKKNFPPEESDSYVNLCKIVSFEHT